MKEQQKNLLDEMGFNTKKKGCDFFISVSTDVVDLIDKISNPEDRVYDIRDFDPKNMDELYHFMDRLYLEDYAFNYECGKGMYFNFLYDFIDSYNPQSEAAYQKSLEVFRGKTDDLDRMIINFSMYSYNNFKEKEKQKMLVKEVL